VITPEKLRVFEKYHGNVDAWARLATQDEKELLKDEDWYEISNVIQHLAILKKRLASPDNDEAINQILALQVGDSNTQRRLLALA
jgi:hypothetical protein